MKNCFEKLIAKENEKVSTKEWNRRLRIIQRERDKELIII